MSGATQDLADFIVARRTGVSPTAGAVARVLLDTCAVAIAGVSEDASRILLDWVASEQTSGPARIWGTSLRVGPSQAALVNGTTAHALDWDDAVPSIPMHPGAVLLPAILAGLATTSASGDDLVHAYDVGSAVFRAVSEVLPIDVHYGRGWHNTSTSGRLAAVAALAHLHRLDEQQTRFALGIVSSSVAGALSNFGTMTKPLHAGEAARDAVIAVKLARRGFTSHAHQLEAPKGFFALYGSASDLSVLPARLAHWEHAWVEDWALKRYPSCFATHRSIDAALRLGVDPAEVASVTVSVPGTSTSPLQLHPPATGLEGKFNLDYTVVRALVSGAPTLADFTDEAVHDPEVRRLMGAFTLDRRQPAGPGPHTWVEVTLTDGTVRRETTTVTYGDAGDPLSDAHLDVKFAAALTFAGWASSESSTLLGRLKAAPYDSDLGWLQDVLAH
ncbi:MmgE/PrpD family protein [Nocardioides sp. Iso805N]|uniref:MmgE/PrpD family protein n=1 Tax=Nocardioides sp. Iso805N TaxID=1283287 RepID=UPI00035DAF48|nr:MmgE/PrpD family protein [Nocardioides sp. Iso805N]